MTEGSWPERVNGGWPEITIGAVPAKLDGIPTPTSLKTEAGTVVTWWTSCGDAGSTAWWELVVGPLPATTLTMTRTATTTMTRPTADQARMVGVIRGED